ncbi:hypothetical protein V1525DRAFT_419123 [Lipomyces kononenkoae]|uniref:Uncharacterized protein n=1 Tax=Lipomyces kononenkoae TaxID=34357 RepID=A0ACC3T2K5_LIPKO
MARPDLEISMSSKSHSALAQIESKAFATDGVAALADSSASVRCGDHRWESPGIQKEMNSGRQQLLQPMSQRRHTFSHEYMSRSAPPTPMVAAYSQQGHACGGYFRGFAMATAASSNTFDGHSIPSSASSRAVSPSRMESSSPKSANKSAHSGLSRSPSPKSCITTKESTSHKYTLSKSYVSNGVAVSSCPYETALINARRRIPYSLGTNPLPPMPASMIKAILSVEDEAKLTKDTEKMFSDLVPSDESARRRRNFIAKLERLLTEGWPGHDIRVHPFGSTENLLCSNDSDVDVCISTSWRKLEDTCMLAKFWANHNMERVVCVPGAKVPIVKIWDPEYNIACDMNVNNTLALENTRMIKTYVQIDRRVRPLAMIIKHWTKHRELNDAAGGGTLSSYSWICLIINFLQLRTPPILPVLHRIGSESRPENVVNGVNISFCDDLDRFKGYGADNTESIGQLLFEFFKWYAFEFDYDRHVVSVRHGRLLSKSEKGWDTLQNNRFCIEEPLVTSRNLGNTVDDISAKGIVQEFRRAYGILASEANLSKCVKRFKFPQDDKPNAVVENGLGLFPGSGPSRRITRSFSSSGSSTKSIGPRQFRGGFYRSQSYRKGSNGTYQGKSMAPGGVYPPPMFKLPPEYGIMPIYSVTPEGYPIAIASIPHLAKPGNSSSADRACATDGTKSSNSVASAQFGYIIPSYFPSPRFPFYYQPAYEDTQFNEVSGPSVSDTNEAKTGRTRSLSPNRQSTRHVNHHCSLNADQGYMHQTIHDMNYQQSQHQQSKQSQSCAQWNKESALPKSLSDFQGQSSESSSDMSDNSPDVAAHVYLPSTPPDCRLDDLVNDAGDDYDLKLPSSHIGGHSDEEDIVVVDDVDGGMTTAHESATYVAQKQLVDRMHGIRSGYTSAPPSRSSSSTALPVPISVLTLSALRSYSMESEEDAEGRRKASGPVIVNGDLSSRVPRSIGFVKDSHSPELSNSRLGSKSYADVLMDQRVFASKNGAQAAEETSSYGNGNVRHRNEISETLDLSLAEFGKNQLNRTSGMRTQNHVPRNPHRDDDGEFWSVSGSTLAASHNRFHATAMPRESAAVPITVKSGGMSYSAAAAASNIEAASSKGRISSISTGSVGSSTNVAGKQNQWTTSTSKRYRKKKSFKKEDSVDSILISAELVKGG